MSILKFPWPVLLCIKVSKSEDDDEATSPQATLPVFNTIDYMDKQELRNKFFELNT